MADSQAESQVSVGIDIDAPPGEVYDIVSDVTRTGEWAAETERCVWVGGATGPVPGARFRGYNRKGWARWATTPMATAADRGKRFAYHVRWAGVLDIATWRFDITPRDGGCHVEESWRDRRHPLVAKVTEAALGITTGRAAHNRRNMERSLEGLKRLAERESS